MVYIGTEAERLKHIRSAVAQYIDAGFAICRLQLGEKNPVYVGWSTHSYDPELLDGEDNVGLQCGWLSAPQPDHHLVGVDLDDLLTLKVADEYLPLTKMIEGRASKPRSHRYYLVPVLTIPHEHFSTAEQAVAAAIAAGKHRGAAKRQFRHPDGHVLVEIIGTGGQMAAPPSIHPSGEVREWEGGTMGQPTAVPWPDLSMAVTRLAAACGWEPREAHRVVSGGAESGQEVPGVPASGRVDRAWSYLRNALGGTGIPGTQVGKRARGTAFGLASRFVNGFDLTPEEALPLMMAWGQRDDQLDEDGNWYPWPENELYRFLDDADRKGDYDGRPRGYLLDREHQERTAGQQTTGGRYADWFARHRRRMTTE